MTMPPALRRWGLCVACLSLCPDPAGIAHRDRHYFAYVIPVGQAQEIAPAWEPAKEIGPGITNQLHLGEISYDNGRGIGSGSGPG